MHLTVLAATGATGRELLRQALARGHTVTAIARDPARIDAPADTLTDDRTDDRTGDRLLRVPADVRDPASVAAAIGPDAVVLSGLGVTRGDRAGTLTAGARAVLDAGPSRVIWLGAFGTGASARAAGAPTRTLLRVALRAELPDKVAADTAVLAAGGTVLHAGPLSNGPVSATRRTVGLDDVARRILPARVSRATVAAAMLDEAEDPHSPGAIAVPLEH